MDTTECCLMPVGQINQQAGQVGDSILRIPTNKGALCFENLLLVLVGYSTGWGVTLGSARAA